MPFGFMPCWSFKPERANSVRRLSPVSKACHQWWMAALGGGSDGSSQNKLAGRLNPAKMEACSTYFLCCLGGRRGDGAERVFGFSRLAVASETGLRRQIRSACSCSYTSSSSVTFCSRATAPSGARGFRQLCAGIICTVNDLSGRKAALWSSGALWRRLISFLPAMVPKGRQFAFGSAFVSSSPGAYW